MGKAIAISVALVLIVAIIAFVVYRLNKKPPRGDLTSKQEHELEKMVHSAASVMRNLGYQPGDIDNTDVLSSRSTEKINQWLGTYEHFKWEKRELNA